MGKPSTDTITELRVYVWRRNRHLPKYLTLRFLALLRPGELQVMQRALVLAIKRTTGPARTLRTRLRRIQSELRQRGYKAPSAKR